MRIKHAPQKWLLRTKIKVGISFFRRLFINALLLSLAHLTGLGLACGCAVLFYGCLSGDFRAPPAAWSLPFFWVIGSAVWELVPGWGLTSSEILRRQIILTSVIFGLCGAIIYLTGGATRASWPLLALAYGFAIVTIPLLGLLIQRLLIRYRMWGVPVAIYGGGHAGRRLAQCLQDERGQGYYPVCIFDDDPQLLNTRICGIPVAGTTELVVDDVPIAILTISKVGSVRITELMETSLANYLRVMIVPHLIHTPWLWASVRNVSGLPSIELSNNLLDPGKCLLKRSFELFLIYFTLPIWCPICLLVGALIWLEDGSNPLFKQARIGHDGKYFETLKFRTMVPDAEAVLQSKLKSDPALRAEWEKFCKLKKDPRITRLGRLLRRSSLDELPQLFNVLRGEMSLIGPRPLPSYHNEQLSETVRRMRQRVRPGMTGLWQVSGRSDTGNDGFERWDSYYVRNWSLWLDVLILARTLRVVLFGSGAR